VTVISTQQNTQLLQAAEDNKITSQLCTAGHMSVCTFIYLSMCLFIYLSFSSISSVNKDSPAVPQISFVKKCKV